MLGDEEGGLSCVCPQHRFEATQMLKAIGLEWIQAHGLEELTFDLLRRKTYNEPFFVSETNTPKPRQPKPVSSPFSKGPPPCLGSHHTAPQSSVQFSSVAQLCPTFCNPMHCSKPGFPVHHQLLELAQIHVYRVSDAIHHLILYRPLLLLPAIFPNIRVFSNESLLHIRWPKYWSFSFSISPSNEYSGLISFRIDWFDLLAVQGTLKSLL